MFIVRVHHGREEVSEKILIGECDRPANIQAIFLTA